MFAEGGWRRSEGTAAAVGADGIADGLVLPDHWMIDRVDEDAGGGGAERLADTADQ